MRTKAEISAAVAHDEATRPLMRAWIDSLDGIHRGLVFCAMRDAAQQAIDAWESERKERAAAEFFS